MSPECRISSPAQNLKTEYAGMLELVDWTDLGSVVERRVGSSPTTRTKIESRKTILRLFFYFQWFAGFGAGEVISLRLNNFCKIVSTVH